MKTISKGVNKEIKKNEIYINCASISHFFAKYNLFKDPFTAWCDTIMSKVEQRISHLNRKIKIVAN